MCLWFTPSFILGLFYNAKISGKGGGNFYPLQVLKKQREDRVQSMKYFGLDCKGSVNVYIVYVYKHLTGGGIIPYDVGG